MTLPDKANPCDALRIIYNLYHIPYNVLVRHSRDIDPTGKGISQSKFFEIIQYGFDPKPGGRVENVLKNLIAELKIKYPSEPKVTQK